MTRTLKLLALMVVAACAMSAMLASAAQAQKGTFTIGKTPETHTMSTIWGEQHGTAEENNFTTTAGEAVTSCTNEGVSYMGDTSAGVETSLTLAPAYKECVANGSLPMKVATNGCTYTFGQPETIPGVETYTGSENSLKCPEGAKIEISIYLGGTLHNEAGYNTKLCTVKIGEQALGGHIIYHVNKEVELTPGKKYDDITARSTISGIKYEESGLCGAHSAEDGTFNSNVTLVASSTTPTTSEHRDLWISDEVE